MEVAILGKITSQFSPTQFHLSLLGSPASMETWGYWRRTWECPNSRRVRVSTISQQAAVHPWLSHGPYRRRRRSTNISEEQAASCFHLQGWTEAKYSDNTLYTYQRTRYPITHHGILNCILEYLLQYEWCYLHTNILKYGILKLTRPASFFFAVWSSTSFFCCSSMSLSNINNSCCFCSCKIINCQLCKQLTFPSV